MRGTRRGPGTELWLLVWLAVGLPAQEAKLDLGELGGPEACGVCHPRHYLEWRGSAHAYSALNPIVQACNRKALLETGGKIGAFCVNCHVPLGARAGEFSAAFDIARESSPAALRGITCEVCHKMERPRAEAPVANATYELHTGNAVQGRLHNPSPTTAHDSITSDFIGKSEFCGHCHDVMHNGALIEKSFAQWSGSVHSERRDRCQDCHMLQYSGQAAVDGPYRETLHRHNFPAASVTLIPFPNKGYQLEQIREFLRTAARLAVFVPPEAQAGGELPVTVRVKNSGAGHNLPTGIANERQLWLEVTVRDAAGAVLFQSGGLDDNGDLMDHHSALRPGADPMLALFSDRFLDEQGKEVPFIFHASRLDERSLKPLEERTITYRVPLAAPLAGSAVRVSVRLLFRSFPPYALRDLGLGHLAKELPIFELDRFEAEPTRAVSTLTPRKEVRVPEDQATIAAAVRAARDGDRVLVRPGTYQLTEPIDFGGKRIAVVGTGGALVTFLRWSGASDAGGASLVICRGGEDQETRLEGFTLSGGRGTTTPDGRRGGAIYIRASSPTIADCIVLDSTAEGGAGGGIAIDGGAPDFERIDVRGCRARLGGGVAALGAGTRLKIVASSVQGNFAAAGGGIHAGRGAVGRIARTVIAGNTARVAGETGCRGGGLCLEEGSAVTLDRLTLVYNRSDGPGGALHAGGVDAALTNSIVWSNQPPELSCRLEHSIVDPVPAVAPAPGGTVRTAYPLFRDPGGSWDPATDAWLPGDYRLLHGSPAIDAGDPLAPAEPDDSRADIGAFSFPQPLNAFVRGDVDGDGNVRGGDAELLAAHLRAGEPLPCADAADIDDSGAIDASDLLLLLTHLLLGQPTIAAPAGECGLDPTFGEGLGCGRKAGPCLGW